MILSNAAIRNRATVFVLMALIAVMGVVSYVTLPRESFPDVPIPLVLISTPYEGVAPEDVETSVTMKIEKELAGLKGLKEIRSTSAEGLSVITVEFMPDVLIDDALQHVRDKVDLAKGELPAAAEEPVIREINVADMPIMIVNISGPISPVRLKRIADRLEDEIENIPGVLSVDVLGGLEREIRLEIDPDRVAAYGLTIPELLELIPSENVNISAGGLETPGTKFNVRLPAEFAEPEEVDHLPLTVRGGRTIYLSDVARVADTFKDRTSYARLDGAPTITLSVRKRVGTNILDVTDRVQAILVEARKLAPLDVTFEPTMDQSDDIRMMVSDLENNVITGLILVVLVLVMFMGWRTSLIVALAIPMSMLMSLAVLDMMGFTLNMVVLFSLILALGMLVDNAIVIVENIFRHRQLGYGRISAAMAGAGEVAWPVITSTATTVAAFLPMIFWPGMMGDFMKYLPITVIITLSSSLFVAMVISPTVCSAVGGGLIRKPAENAVVRGYRRALSGSLHHWGVTVCMALLLLAGLGIFYARRGEGHEFFPKIDPRQAVINIRSPQGTALEKSDDLARIAEGRLGPFGSDLKHVISNAGSAGDSPNPFSSSTGGPHMANVNLVFHDFQDRPRKSADAVKEIRQTLTDIAGAEVKVEQQKEGPPTGAAVTVRLIGEDFDTLGEIADKAKRLIAGVPDLVNLRSDLEATRPELVFQVDRRRAMMLGVSSRVIGNFLKTAIFGWKVGTFRQFNDEYDITVRLPITERRHIQDLFRLRVPNSFGKAVPLSSLGQFDYRPGFGNIYRVDQKRVVTLTGDAEGRLGPAVLKDVEARLDPLGDATVRADDIKDWKSLCRKLIEADKAESTGPLRRVAEQMGSGLLTRTGSRARAAARRIAEGPKPTDADEQAVLAGLNNVLGRRDLYDQAAFAGAKLTEEAQEYLKRDRKDLSAGELRRLNRLLLEAAFGEQIARRQRLALPMGYSIEYAGEKEEQEKAFAFLILRALPIALLLIVLILVLQFNTFSAPLVIMVTVLLSFIGVLVGLLVTDMPFGTIMTGVGVISLAGVVVNNAIVLLDYTRQLQRRGMDVISAAVQAGVTRLRPVLLTATTTILGLIPMAAGVGLDFHSLGSGGIGEFFSTRSECSQFWKSMAVAVIFGLALATLLTLFVVP
ncbi:MAG: efflux RND transporter permease subunit, partial [Planctomycetota bacterium]